MTFCILNFLVNPKAFAILAPEVYIKTIQSSDIKAIAVVEKVEVLSEEKRPPN